MKKSTDIVEIGKKSLDVKGIVEKYRKKGWNVEVCKPRFDLAKALPTPLEHSYKV